MGEKLKWLMQALNISGVELSDFLGVDYAIVSKWRTGKRTLKYQSKHSRKVGVPIFWRLRLSSDGHIVRDMLKKLNPELDENDPAQLEHALTIWLTVPKTPEETEAAPPPEKSGFFIVNVETTLGVENMFREQWRFFRSVQEMHPGQTITVIDFSAVNWLSVDISFVEKTVSETLKTIKCGHKLRIIDQITETYRPWDYMFRFIPIYLNENVTAYFYRDPQPSPLRQNIFLRAEGRSAPDGVKHLGLPRVRREPAYYRQPDYVRFYRRGRRDYAWTESRSARYEPCKTNEIHELLDIIDAHIKSSRQSLYGQQAAHIPQYDDDRAAARNSRRQRRQRR